MLQELKGDNMKGKRNKQWGEYDEEGYAALAKYLLTYLQSYFPYSCGWMPYYYEFEPKNIWVILVSANIQIKQRTRNKNRIAVTV